MGPLLYLQGGGLPPTEGPGRQVLSKDWRGGLNAPYLDADWLAQPFPDQLALVGEWLEESDAAVGFGWGAWLLLCAMEERAKAGLTLPPVLLLSCFMGKGRYTGQEQDGHILPRSESIARALGGGDLAGCEIRFLHGQRDEMAPLAALQACDLRRFSLQVVDAGHLLRGPGERMLKLELERLQMRMAQIRRHSSS